MYCLRCGVSWVYPRVCGGTDGVRIFGKEYEGLSPRVRGNLIVMVHLHQFIGSIPACAGEPNAPKMTMALTEVYPRVCGGTF